MKKMLVIAAVALAPALYVQAEPRSFEDLSFRQDRASVERGEVTRLVHPVGHGKYRPNQSAAPIREADTEIAAFEEVSSAPGVARPDRADRIPR
ncbi:MAG: hypothetical protein WDA10_07275 [Porticoccaceae bacterium]|jgi:hypothetical protein|nr:hypothetical protein [Porticoccaceae bacterium]MEA3300980.1 hypothetical protein [Pseudomonadota bacterium]HLS99461.1 hypothetical protein [Porticoccaceae bacterium]